MSKYKLHKVGKYEFQYKMIISFINEGKNSCPNLPDPAWKK